MYKRQGLTDAPEDIFGKAMSIPDEIMVKYFRLASDLPVDEIDAIEAGLQDDSLHPNKVKRQLARNLVALYHGDQEAQAAEEHFDKVFKAHEVPDDIPELSGDLELNDEGQVYLAALLHKEGLASSAAEARRLIDGGGVKIDDEPVASKCYNVDPDALRGCVLKVGKRKFLRIP